MSEMWKRTEFILANGMSQLPNSVLTNDISPYECFDGGLGTDIDLDFSDAVGKRPRKKKSGKSKGTFEKVMSYTPIGMVKEAIDRRNSPEGLARRQAKDDTKKATAEAQNKAVEQATKSSEGDALLLAQIQQPSADLKTATAPSTTMSKGTKTALIVGGVAVAGLIGFMLYKKLKK